MQPVINIGTFGHVDHGKTTLTKAMTGKWTDTHSEELKRGVTIRLGYADFSIYYCPKCDFYWNAPTCPRCGEKAEFKRKLSIVDAPGHESLMATTIAGSSIIDAALFIIAANEECPQEQTREHLMVLELLGIDKIIIVQTKVDLVSKEEAMKNYRQIREFIKGTIAENAPIVPISSTYNLGLHHLYRAIEEYFPTPKRDENQQPLAYIIRSFDVNKPGTEPEKMVGGVVGGAIVKGVFRIGDEIEIKPGVAMEKGYVPLTSKIISLHSGGEELTVAKPSGLIAIGTELDPSLTKADGLAGSLVALKGTLPEPRSLIRMKYQLLERKDMENPPLTQGEVLLLNVYSTTTVGIVKELKAGIASLILKKPIVVLEGAKIAISRRIGHRWRLAGIGSVVQ